MLNEMTERSAFNDNKISRLNSFYRLFFGVFNFRRDRRFFVGIFSLLLAIAHQIRHEVRIKTKVEASKEGGGGRKIKTVDVAGLCDLVLAVDFHRCVAYLLFMIADI